MNKEQFTAWVQAVKAGRAKEKRTKEADAHIYENVCKVRERRTPKYMKGR